MRDIGARLRTFGASRVVASFDYLDAARRGGVERERLDVIVLDIEGLLSDLDALVVRFDLRDREIVPGGSGRLLREIVAEWLGAVAASGRLQPCQRAGHLYVIPDLGRRGNSATCVAFGAPSPTASAGWPGSPAITTPSAAMPHGVAQARLIR